jgi:pyruvate/2-oxoglutarate dehydrogenase complex dihydrolipoamide dehydrogenase (E3) component
MTDLPEMLPSDEHNQLLVSNVHPPEWENPVPSGRYNLVVVGGGSAGLISAAVAAGLGAEVALVERHWLGGDCLNVGCVPSKAVIRASRSVAEARAAAAYGWPQAAPQDIDFGAAMRRMRAVRARISHEDAATRYRDELGVEIFLGSARFVGRDQVEVDGETLRFSKAVIATGARAALPPVPGLADAAPRTNETIFQLTERPARLGVIGGGPIGCEMAQAFQRLGSVVTVIDLSPQLLSREDPDAAAIVQARLAEEGVHLQLGAQVDKIECRDDGKAIFVKGADGATREIVVDEILVAAGRQPNLEGLDLEAAGVESDPRRGVLVDDYLRTANRNIFAAGDICMGWKFTHAADAAAKIVVENALFLPRKKLSDLVMPWCTYTDPEVAHVGLSEHDAVAQGIEIDTYKVELSEVNRAVTDGEEEGFVKVHTRKGKDEILGATIVASHAGEMISQITLAMVSKLGLGSLMQVIHPYPTQAEGIKRAASAYFRTRATPTVKKVLDGWMRLRR